MDPVSLSNLGRGAAGELFEQAMARALENIRDPNTDHKTAREITLRVKIKPDEGRATGQVELSVSTKLAGVKPFKTNMFIGEERGVVVAYESDPKQFGLFPKTEPDPKKVRQINDAAEGSQE
jgi:hypothetical protein